MHRDSPTARPPLIGVRVRRRAAVLLLLIAALAPARAAETSSLRFVHLSPDAPLVDVLVGGQLTFRDIDFAQRSHVITLPAGTHEVRVFPHRPPRRVAAPASGPGAAAPASPLEPLVMILDLSAGSVTTLVLTGAYEPPIEEELRGHLSIQVEPPDAEIVLDGPRGYQSVLTGDQFLVGLEPGPYRAEVRRSGFLPVEYETEVSAGSTSIVSITLQEADDEEEPVERPAPRVQRQPTWHGLELQPYLDERVPVAAPGTALVRFVHVAPTLPDFDVVGRPDEDDDDDDGTEEELAAEEPLHLDVSRLRYPNASEYGRAAMEAYRLEFRVAGTASLVHVVSGLEFAPGATYTIFVSADPVTNQVWLVPMVDALVPQHVLRGEDP